jgi:hypothetical protein
MLYNLYCYENQIFWKHFMTYRTKQSTILSTNNKCLFLNVLTLFIMHLSWGNSLLNIYNTYCTWVWFMYSFCNILYYIFHSLYLRKLELRRIDARLSLLYKIHHGLVAIPIQEYLTPLSRPNITPWPSLML